MGRACESRFEIPARCREIAASDSRVAGVFVFRGNDLRHTSQPDRENDDGLKDAIHLPSPSFFVPFSLSLLPILFLSLLFCLFISFFPRRRRPARVVCHCLGVVSPSRAPDFSPRVSLPEGLSSRGTTLFSPLVFAQIERGRVCVARRDRVRHQEKKRKEWLLFRQRALYRYCRCRARPQLSSSSSPPLSSLPTFTVDSLRSSVSR